MTRKIDTMRILSCPRGMENVHYVVELTGVKGTQRTESGYLKVEYVGEISTTTIDFNDFETRRSQIRKGSTGIYIADLSQVDAIAVRYRGRDKWNRHYLSQITRKGGRFPADKSNRLINN